MLKICEYNRKEEEELRYREEYDVGNLLGLKRSKMILKLIRVKSSFKELFTLFVVEDFYYRLFFIVSNKLGLIDNGCILLVNYLPISIS